MSRMHAAQLAIRQKEQAGNRGDKQNVVPVHVHHCRKRPQGSGILSLHCAAGKKKERNPMPGPPVPQDIKNLRGPGTPQQRIDAGNISFGVTCPFGAEFCQFAAGAAQTMAGNPDFSGTLRTGFDTPSDNRHIRIGQAMRAAGCHE